MAGLVAPALASQARAEADQALGRAVRAEDQVTMMDHGLTAHTQDVSSFVC